MTSVKKKIEYVPHQKTFAFRQQMQVGAALADQLPKYMELKECAEKLGLSQTMVRRLECQALYKVQQMMKKFKTEEL